MTTRPYPLAVVASTEMIGGWATMKSHRWAHTSLRRVLPMRITGSTWVAAPSSTMPPSPSSGAGDRWKRFLSHTSRNGIPSGCDPHGQAACQR